MEKPILTDIVIIAAIPAVAYYAALSYLDEQATLLGIPGSLVSVSFDFVLLIGALVGLGVVIVVMVMLAMIARDPTIFASSAGKANWMTLLVTPGAGALGVFPYNRMRTKNATRNGALAVLGRENGYKMG